MPYSCICNVTTKSFNYIHENKILTKFSKFTVYGHNEFLISSQSSHKY